MGVEPKRALEKFRASFRRESIISRFNQERANANIDLQVKQAKNILQILKNEGKINAPQNGKLFSILSQSISDSFISKALQQKLQINVACAIERNFNSFSLGHKITLVETLNDLIFKNAVCLDDLVTKTSLFNTLIKEVGKLKLEEMTQLILLHRIVTLLLNLSSEPKSNLNVYLVQFRWINIIIKQLSKAQQNLAKTKYIHNNCSLMITRLTALKLFSNITKSLKQNYKDLENLVIQLVKQVLQDEQYFEEQPGRMLLLLTEGMTIENFWVEILGQSEGVSQQILRGIERIQARCFSKEFLLNKKEILTEKQVRDFEDLLAFYIELYYVRESFEKTVFDWQLAVQNFLNGFMLAQFLIEASKNNQKERISLALQAYSLLAKSQFVSAEQLLAIRPADHTDMLLHIWTDPEVLKGKEGHYCLRILQRLVKSDGQKWYQRLMELKVVMTLEDIVNQNKSQVCPLLYESMDLLLMLCVVTDDGRLLRMFENKTLSKAIDQLSKKDKGIRQRVRLGQEFIRKSELKKKKIAQQITVLFKKL